MAQAGSAQREPSMEEILASIRRIIEDSDASAKSATAGAVRPDNDAQPVVQPEPEPRRVNPDGWGPEGESVGTVIEVDAFRAELREPQQPAQPPADSRRPISLAEVQAQVAADQIAARQAAERAYHGVPEPAPVPQPAPVLAQPATIAALTPESDWQFVDMQPPAAPAPEAYAQDPMDAVMDDISAGQAHHEAAPAADAADSGDDAGPGSLRTIISDHAGRQVAAAFHELSDALSTRNKKSFEQMAEDMLRPMLQDWLDNNLPHMVERLVREEIERVARGA